LVSLNYANTKTDRHTYDHSPICIYVTHFVQRMPINGRCTCVPARSRDCVMLDCNYRNHGKEGELRTMLTISLATMVAQVCKVHHCMILLHVARVDPASRSLVRRFNTDDW
jgi:hypothetical protein